MTEFRALDETERRLIEALLSIEFPGRAEIREQMKLARVRTIDENGSLEFSAAETPRAPVVGRVPVEAEGRDMDGVAVHALLHVVDGKVVELELYRIDGRRVQMWPTVDELELFAPPPSKKGRPE